jgi:NADPH:quinone reductase
LDLLAFNGQLAYIAGAPDFKHVKPFSKALSFQEIALGGTHLSGNMNAQIDLARMAEELAVIVSERKVSPMLTEVISMDEIPSALVRLSERHVRGKIVAKLI